MLKRKNPDSLIKYIYNFFRKLKFRYKLSFYFMIFGLFIGYVSFVLYTHLAVKQIMSIMSGIADSWIKSDASGNDSILQYIDKPYISSEVKSYPVLRYIIDDLSRNAAIKRIIIYYYNMQQGKWYFLYKDNNGYIRSSGDIVQNKLAELESSTGNTVSYTDSIYPGNKGVMFFRVNITKPGDINKYVVEIGADRAGFLKRIGSVNILLVYALSIFILSLVITRVIAIHISRPIQKLSRQASQIACGDLDVRTEIISRDEIGELSFAINTMADEIRDYLMDINERMEAISVMNRIDKAVLSSSSRSDLISRITSFVSEHFRSCYIALGIADSSEKAYHFLSGSPNQGESKNSRGNSLSFNRIGEDLLRRNRNFYMLDPDSDSDTDVIRFINHITGMNFSVFINLPIYIDEEYIGSFVAGRTGDDRFTSFEVDSLTALADQFGVAMKSVRHMEEKEKMYLGIITALSRAIDAKSRWTAGHSERVAGYSVKIARRLKLPDEFVRDIQMSAILHDIGKIGVPENLLDKPGKLSPEEYIIVKEHSCQGALIVSEIPGSENVKKGVLSHHEAWDGKGYPFGLQGEDIPLIARIITVADVFDSIVSDRPYRKGMLIQDAVDFIIREKGRLFDPELVNIMTDMIISGEFRQSSEESF